MDYDAELRAHNEHLRAATGIRPGEQVLDVGCGAGQTTREAAAAAAPGHVLGVDVSESLLARARELTPNDNVTYELGDAQVHAFASEHYDIVISRFGTMFFADPVAAFRNIAGALRPRGRVVLLVWQTRERNAWAEAIDAAVGATPERDGPFSLGDPAVTTGILERAGLSEIGFADVHESMFFGPDVDTALEWVCGFTSTRDALARLEPAEHAAALDRLRETLAAHYEDSHGVVFDSRAWLVMARR
jgi:SAM-dependent methyltransferase